jgi:predicted nuclease of predicted toxin-antitoxin system
MKLSGYSYVCDENIHPDVADYLKLHVKSVRTVSELHLQSQDDETILQAAHVTQSVILTHDSDFGKIIFMKKVPFTGIIYLRPGHIVPAFTIETLTALFEKDFVLTPPFMLIAERKKDSVKIRIRSLD